MLLARRAAWTERVLTDPNRRAVEPVTTTTNASRDAHRTTHVSRSTAAPQEPEARSHHTLGAAFDADRRFHGHPTPDINKGALLGVILVANFMVTLDIAIVNVALPSLQAELDVDPGDLQWVVTMYALMLGGFLLLGGRAADLLGRRNVLVTGVGSSPPHRSVAGLSNDLEPLIAARAAQGIGARTRGALRAVDHREHVRGRPGANQGHRRLRSRRRQRRNRRRDRRRRPHLRSRLGMDLLLTSPSASLSSHSHQGHPTQRARARRSRHPRRPSRHRRSARVVLAISEAPRTRLGLHAHPWLPRGRTRPPRRLHRCRGPDP